MSSAVSPPGIAGIKQLCKDIQFWVSPWSGDEHLALYQEINNLIGQVDPAVVVLDTLLRPAIDATRDRNWQHIIMSPNTVIDNFPMEQPWGGMFWKYPAMGSGLPFPVPWRKIPENIYLNIRFIYSVLFMPDVKVKRDFLKSKGLKDPINFYALYRPDVPWLTQTLPEASRPVDMVPVNVTCTGPISLSLGTVAEQDKDLARWLANAPTVLINLGGGFMWLEPQAKVMAQAVANILRRNPKLQILWKFRTEEDGLKEYNVTVKPYSDDFKVEILPFLENGRLKMERWLVADPTSLLESGHIVASVHHGGTGCYHEATGVGVPQVILPQWLDLYNFAQMSEDLNIGAWGCRETSPQWTSDCLQDAILKVADGGVASATMKKNAARLGKLAQSDPGRYVAAREIARIAGLGSS
ncbi:hypothetical protein JX266_006149 [Neoarthrinium moseri]|nr:hypothetical protein JX266_006149 [Neoarthrinium moseri]